MYLFPLTKYIIYLNNVKVRLTLYEVLTNKNKDMIEDDPPKVSSSFLFLRINEFTKRKYNRYYMKD